MRRIHSSGTASSCRRACLWLEGTRQVVPTRATQPSLKRFSPNKSHRDTVCKCSTPCSAAASARTAHVWQTASSLWRSSKVQQRGQHTQAAAAATEAHPSSTPVCREGRPMGLSLGSLPLIEQQLSVAGSIFSLVAPQDVDAVMDMYIDKVLKDKVSKGLPTRLKGSFTMGFTAMFDISTKG